MQLSLVRPGLDLILDALLLLELQLLVSDALLLHSIEAQVGRFSQFLFLLFGLSESL